MSQGASNVPRAQWPENALWCFDWKERRYALWPSTEQGISYELRYRVRGDWWPTSGHVDELIAAEHAIGMLVKEKGFMTELSCKHCGDPIIDVGDGLDLFCGMACIAADAQDHAEAESC